MLFIKIIIESLPRLLMSFKLTCFFFYFFIFFLFTWLLIIKKNSIILLSGIKEINAELKPVMREEQELTAGVQRRSPSRSGIIRQNRKLTRGSGKGHRLVALSAD